MSNFVISQIRTYTPILVGALLSWLTTIGLTLDAETQSALIIALTGTFQALYYFVARLAERRWPKIGAALLGSGLTPMYVKHDSRK